MHAAPKLTRSGGSGAVEAALQFEPVSAEPRRDSLPTTTPSPAATAQPFELQPRVPRVDVVTAEAGPVTEPDGPPTDPTDGLPSSPRPERRRESVGSTLLSMQAPVEFSTQELSERLREQRLRIDQLEAELRKVQQQLGELPRLSQWLTLAVGLSVGATVLALLSLLLGT